MNARIDSLPFARIALTIAIGCALAACGGGGGDSSDGDTFSRGVSGGDVGAERDDPRSWFGVQVPWVPVPLVDDGEDVEALRQYYQAEERNRAEEASAPEFPRQYLGTLADENGVHRNISDWVKHVDTTCPTNNDVQDTEARAGGLIRCLAGTYEGIDLLSQEPCRTTLKADGTMIQQNGSVTLPAFKIRPEHVVSFLDRSFGMPLLAIGNFNTGAAYGQFFTFEYTNSKMPKIDYSKLDPSEYEDLGFDAETLSKFSRYEGFSMQQTNLDPVKGPVIIRTCVVSYRYY